MHSLSILAYCSVWMAAENSGMQRAHSICELIRRVSTETIQINMHKTGRKFKDARRPDGACRADGSLFWGSGTN